MVKAISSSKKIGGHATATTKSKRKTQAERREDTRSKVLESACRIFGEKGYADTSNKDIADDLGLTITPIYHYFGNKQALFLAVTETMELKFARQIEEVAANATKLNLIEIWDVLVGITQQPNFARIVLCDAPNILGRERWNDTSVVHAASKVFREHLSIWLESGSLEGQLLENDIVLLQRMLTGCFSEAALMLAANPDYDSRPLVMKISKLLHGLGM